MLKKIGSLFKKRKLDSKVITGAIEEVFKAAKSDGWTLILLVNPWRDETGTVHGTSLRLVGEQSLGKTEIQLEAERFEKGTTWQFKITEHASWVELIEVEGSVEDVDLNKDRELPPIILKDEILGSFCLDRRSNWYQGSWCFGGRSCILTISRSGEGDMEDLIRARNPLRRLQDQAEKILTGVGNLTGLYNDQWRQDGEPLGEEEFLERVTIESIVVESGDELVLYFDCGGLFLDHSIEVRIDMSGEILGVVIA